MCRLVSDLCFIAALLLGIVCAAQAQFSSFPPGVFTGRAALDASSGAAAVVWTKTDNPAIQTGLSGSTATFACTVGCVTAAGKVGIVCVSYTVGGPMTGITIGGKTATLAGSSSAGAEGASLWYANMASGISTTNVVLTGTAGLDTVGIAMGVLTTTTATPGTSQGLAYGFNPDPQTTAAITAPTNGISILCGESNTPNASPTFNNWTSDYNTISGTAWQVLLGHISSSGSQVPSISGYNFAGFGMAAAPWSP